MKFIDRFLVVFVLFLVTAVSARADVQLISLPSIADDLAIDPKTGVVAAAHSASDTIAFYNKLWENGEAAGVVKVGKSPKSILFKQFGKQRLFVALCADDGRLFVFDADKRTVLKEAKIGLANCKALRASINPADPYVYYTGGDGHDSRLARYNLETNEDEGAFALGGMGNSVANAYISADGALVYTLGPWSPSGFQVYRIQPRLGKDAPSATQLLYEHNSRGGYVPDMFSSTVAAGNKIYSADLKTEVVTLTDMPIAFSPYDPAVVTMTKDELKSYSTNTYRLESRVPLPMKEVMANADDVVAYRRPNAGGAKLLWEPSKKYVLFCGPRKVAVVPYAELEIKEPLLGVDVEGNTRATVGQAMQLTLRPRDPKTTIKLDSAPKSLKLTNNQLSWTPGNDDIGPVEITVSLAAGEVQRKQTFGINVSGPFVQLPFTPTLFSASSDAKLAIVAQSGSMNRSDLPQSNGGKLALIDLTTGKTLAERTLPQSIGAVGVDAKFVYASLADSDAFYALSIKDLSDVKRVFASSRVTRFTSIKDKLLFAMTQQSKPLVLKLPSLDPLSPTEALGVAAEVDPNEIRMGMRTPATGPAWLGGKWQYDGVIYDAELQATLGLAGSGAILNVSQQSGRINMRQRDNMNSGVNRWGVFSNGQQLIRESGQPFGGAMNFDGGNPTQMTVLQSVPLAVGYNARFQGNGMRSGEVLVSLLFKELISGETRSTRRLLQEAAKINNGGPQWQLQQPPVFECIDAQTILVSYSDRLFVVPLKESWVDQIVAPLSVSPETQSVTVLGEQPVKITLEVKGSKSAKASMALETPGATIDKNVLILEPSAIRSAAIKTAATRLISANAGNQVAPSDAVMNYRRQTSPLFKRLTGREAKGVVIAQTFQVVAQDEQLQQGNAAVTVLMELSPEDIIKAAQAAPTFTRTTETPTTQPTDMEGRVRQLENEVRILQGKVDLLTQLLQGQNRR